MDRAGVVGPDGPTHHGVFDISLLINLPNIIVTAPKDGNELKNLLLTALKNDKPFAIRYPKDSSINFTPNNKVNIIEIGKWEIINSGNEVAILSVGSMVNESIKAINSLDDKCKPSLINCRFIKPIDNVMLDNIINTHKYIITIEEGSLCGGFGSSILNYISDNDKRIKVIRMGIPDQYIEQASRTELLEQLKLNSKNIAKTIKSLMI